MNFPHFEKLIEKYDKYASEIIDFEKFNLYSIVHHSTAIEGSSLALDEAYLLLDEGLTPKNKPLTEVLMVADHYHALLFTLTYAKAKNLLSLDFIHRLAAKVMKNTGSKISAMAGDFRKLSVRVGDRYFMDYKKVPSAVETCIKQINSSITKPSDVKSIYELSFLIHFEMVSIHPFADGNGRTARLLMNYVQHYHNLPLSIVFKEDKAEYYQALEESREKNQIEIFNRFMFEQTEKHLRQELDKVTSNQ